MDVKYLADQLSEQYLTLLSVNTSKERKKFEETIDEKLTHLEEFCGILDIIRSENRECIDKLVPNLLFRKKEIENIYRQIDNMEDFIKVVKANLQAMEEEINKAEELFARTNKVKKFFNTFLSNKRSVAGELPPRYCLPSIFKTEDFIKTKPTEVSPIESKSNINSN